jgi:hypothetical protein
VVTTADELLSACMAAAGKGADFPVVWTSILKGHHFVAGLPIQSVVGKTPVLQVPLLSGEAIIVGPGSGDYKLSR